MGSADGPTQTTETLVIGGGPAGLAAAVYLARFRRHVLLIEDGASRAATIPRSHNVAGFPDGIAGADLLDAMRRQAERYGVRFKRGCVEALQRRDDGFTARWREGRIDARRVVLATGVSDIAPTMPHLAQALREGALHYCPVCDGYEVIGQSVGLVADSGADTFEALYVRHFTERVTLFVVSDDVHFSERQRRELAEAGVTVVLEPVQSLGLIDTGVAVGHGGQHTIVDSVYCALGTRVHSELATALGAEHDDDGYLLTDHQQQTTLAGLYAAGDVVKGLNQISVGVGEAAVAASALHLALLGLK